MKIGIVVGVILGIVIVVATAALVLTSVIIPAVKGTPLASTTPSPSTVVSGATVLPTTAVPPRPPASTTPGVPPGAAAVNFSPNITSVTGTDLSRTINATLTNSGTADAHNVAARVDITSQGSRIRINNQDFVSQSFGTLKAGASVNIQYTVSVGVFDGLKIISNGALVTLTVTSDEKTQTASYNYTP